MPPRKTQTIKEVMKESKPIIDQKLGATRSKKIKKNESNSESDYQNAEKKQKKSTKIKASNNNQSFNQDDQQDKQISDPQGKLTPSQQDKLSHQLKSSSQLQIARTKLEKITEKHNTKIDELKVRQGNGNQDLEKEDENNQNPKNAEQINNLLQEEKQKCQVIQIIDQDKLLNQENNNNKELPINNQSNQLDSKVIPQIIITAPEVEIKNGQKRQEEEKEQLEKKIKVTVDIVFCCDVNILDCNCIDSLKDTIELIIQQLKENALLSSNIKFRIVSFNDTNQKLQQCQITELCDEDVILQNLDKIKQMGQVDMQKGAYYGLKLATSTTKWRKESNYKSFRYIIHIANQRLQIKNYNEELESIIQEMNNKNIRYKYLRIDKKIDLEFEGKQYFQNNLKSYEESFLKEFESLKNVLSSMILRELQHENDK